MRDALHGLWLAHDGPAPSAELAAARWGAGAGRRLARGANGALLEARLRACIAALARLRRDSGFAMSEAAARLARRVADYRAAAVSARG